MTEEEIISRIICLGFGGDEARYERFKAILLDGLPANTEVALRGSVVTNEKWANGEPFDADGPGTSDLDVSLIGEQVMDCWGQEHFYVPGLHTRPLSDKTPEAAPELDPLRRRLQELVGRPVNFQATNDLVQKGRRILLDQPYFKIIRNPS